MPAEQPDTPAQPDAPLAPVPERELPLAKPVRVPLSPAERAARRATEVARTKRYVRCVLGAIAVALTCVFAAAFRIHPYDEDGTPRTMATHTQLGMAPCNFVELTGKPCPACGMTTSFALLVRGDVSASLRANWVGSVICVLWALTLVWAVASGIRGKPLFVRRGRGEVTFTIIAGVVLVLMLARWAAIMIE